MREQMKLILPAAMIACMSLMLGCRKDVSPAVVNAATKIEDPATRELHAIGDSAVTAVLGKDFNALLDFDPDPEDEASLKSKSGDLYCYLYDASCNPEGTQRAVYDLFSTAPKLGIDTSVAHLDGKQYGLLMFYDKTRVSPEELYTPGFLCTDKGRRNTVTWRFIRPSGKWTTSTLFEYKTERSCKAS
jgi:hypothetical protein